MFSTSTVASSTRMPIARASPPSVIRLIVLPDSHSPITAAISASGILSTTTSTLRQSRRNNSTISPVSTAPSTPFDRQRANGPRHVGRLVELEADVDIVGQHGLHFGQMPLDLVDDAQRRRVGPLGGQQVNRPPAVDQRVAGRECPSCLRSWPDRADRRPAPPPVRIGMLPNSSICPTSELSGTIGYLSPMCTLPEGLIVLPLATAEITSSGEM